MTKTISKKCLPCEGLVKKLRKQEVLKFIKNLKDWKLLGLKKIRKEFVFKDFKEAMKFVKKIGFLAEKEGHHPDIFISYNRVILDLYTHSVSGLTENDFILASKINEIKLNEEK
jgi:4a-hydroxytetrahydrobiopterin dehydratase